VYAASAVDTGLVVGSIGAVTNLPGRLVVLALAVVGLGLGLHWRAEAVACGDARQAFFDKAVRGDADAADAKRLTDRCTDPEQLAVFAGGVARTDRVLARQLAEAAAERAPDTFAPWAALALSRPEGSAGARAAWRRAKALNPRWTQPAPN